MGTVFLFIFLLFNMVLMLNFVIAILGDTYSTFEPLSNGLYLVVLLAQFPQLEWDDHFGSIVCTQTPWTMISLIMYPALYISSYKNKLSYFPQYNLISVNNFITHCIYLPNGVICTFVFAIFSTLCIPFAYFSMICTLAYKTWYHKYYGGFKKEFCCFISFLIFGPLILAVSVIVEIPIFFYNLFTSESK